MIEKNTVRPRGTDSAKIIQVIETTSVVGLGSENDPCRMVTEYWSLSGDLLFRKDCYTGDTGAKKC